MLRISICAIGRAKASPAASLFADYQKRFDRTGRALSLGPLRLIELDDRKSTTRQAQAELLRKSISAGAFIVMLDERGTAHSSPAFAKTLAQWRDAGHTDIAFVIGGADGIDPEFRQEAGALLSFGKMVWPHMLARVMLAEQLYRAASILANLPYHRA